MRTIQREAEDAAIVLGHDRFEIVDGDLTAMKTGLLQRASDFPGPPGAVASSGVVLIFMGNNLSLVSGESTSIVDVTSEFQGRSDDLAEDAALLGGSAAVLCYSLKDRPTVGKIYCVQLVGGGKRIAPGPWCISQVPLRSKIVACAPSAREALLLITPFDARLYSAKTGSIVASLTIGWTHPIALDTLNCPVNSNNSKVAILSRESLDLITISASCDSEKKGNRISLQASREKTFSECYRGDYSDFAWLEDDVYCLIYLSGEALICGQTRNFDDDLQVVCDTKPCAVDAAILSGSGVAKMTQHHQRLPELVELSSHNVSILHPQCVPLTRCREETRQVVPSPNASLQAVHIGSRKWIVILSTRARQHTCAYEVFLHDKTRLTAITSISRLDRLSRELNSETIGIGAVANRSETIVVVTKNAIGVLSLDSPQLTVGQMAAADVIREPNATHLFAAFEEGKYVLVASSKKIALVRIDNDLKFTLICRESASGEIAAISLKACRQHADDALKKNEVFVGVATWEGRVDVYRVSKDSDLILIHTVPTHSEYLLVRSLAFLDNKTTAMPIVLAGFADGHVAVCHDDSCQVFRIGGAPVSFKPMNGDVVVRGVNQSAMIHACTHSTGNSKCFRVISLPHRDQLTPLVASREFDTAAVDLVAWMDEDETLATGTLGCSLKAEAQTLKTRCGRAKHVLVCPDAQLVLVSASFDDTEDGEVSEILIIYSSLTLDEVGRKPLGVEIAVMCIAPPAPTFAISVDVIQTFALITSVPGDTLGERAAEYRGLNSRRAVFGGSSRCAITICEVTKSCNRSFDILPSTSTILQGTCRCAIPFLESSQIAAATGTMISIVQWCSRAKDDFVETDGEQIVSFELAIAAKASMPNGEEVVALASSGPYLAAAEQYHSVCVFFFDGKLLNMVAMDVNQGRLLSSIAFVPECEGNNATDSLPCLILSDRENCRIAVLAPSEEKCQVLCADDAIRDESDDPPSPQERENQQISAPMSRAKAKLIMLREMKAWGCDVVKFVTQSKDEPGILLAVCADGSLEQLRIVRGNAASRLGEIAKSVGTLEGSFRAESCELPVVHSRALHKFFGSGCSDLRNGDEKVDGAILRLLDSCRHHRESR